MDSSTLPSLPSIASCEEFYQFHSIDRLLYWILVINLHRDPNEAMQVLAMWIWLELVGHRHLVMNLTTLSYILIKKIADETISCLKYINTSPFSFFSYDSYPPCEGYDISLLQSVTQKEISLHLLYDNRDVALHGVAKIMRNICARAFGDIMQQAVIRNTFERLVDEQRQRVKQIEELLQQQQQHRFWFGSAEPSLVQIDNTVRGVVDHQIQLQNHPQENKHDELVPQDERTLFLTFSKGYPVQEWEVMEFFTLLFGNYVEGLYMQDVKPHEQALFARIVFHSTTIIDKFINGSEKVKFKINGKHVWARKFVPKNSKNMMHIPIYNNNYNGESSETVGLM